MLKAGMTKRNVASAKRSSQASCWSLDMSQFVVEIEKFRVMAVINW
jgi:hypothetical protein